MGRAFVGLAGIGLLGAIAHMFAELVQHRFKLVDAAPLLVHHLVQRLDQVFLLRQLDFNIDKAHFGMFCIFHGAGGEW